MIIQTMIGKNIFTYCNMSNEKDKLAHQEESNISYKHYTRCIYALIAGRSASYATNILPTSNYEYYIKDNISKKIETIPGYDFYRNIKIYNLPPNKKISIFYGYFYGDIYYNKNILLSNKIEYNEIDKSYSFPEIKDICFLS